NNHPNGKVTVRSDTFTTTLASRTTPDESTQEEASSKASSLELAANSSAETNQALSSTETTQLTHDEFHERLIDALESQQQSTLELEAALQSDDEKSNVFVAVEAIAEAAGEILSDICSSRAENTEMKLGGDEPREPPSTPSQQQSYQAQHQPSNAWGKPFSLATIMTRLSRDTTSITAILSLALAKARQHPLLAGAAKMAVIIGLFPILVPIFCVTWPIIVGYRLCPDGEGTLKHRIKAAVRQIFWGLRT
ncbi:hypothetical protein HK405_006906, partial [Cladochytrium tenue]